MNFLLTGGTGIVGSHVIFDWLKQAIKNNTQEQLFVVIRDNDVFSAKERLIRVLNNDTRPDYLKHISIVSCLKRITIISEDLVSIKKETLEAHQFSTIIHCAGSTNLSHATSSKQWFMNKIIKQHNSY